MVLKDTTQWTPPGSTMDEMYDALAERLIKKLDTQYSSGGNGPQFLVGVAGVPGAGKSTVASEVCKKLNKLAGNSVAVVVPMDGYHLTRAQLDQLSDPEYAHLRRGSYWTFDEKAFVDMVKKLRSKGSVSVPSFDHAVGDPVPGAIQVSTATPVVILEGNYLLLEYFPWCELRALFDEIWYVDCDIDEAMERVEKRHIGTGMAPVMAALKVKSNDRINAELISSMSALRADVRVPSISNLPAIDFCI